MVTTTQPGNPSASLLLKSEKAVFSNKSTDTLDKSGRQYKLSTYYWTGLSRILFLLAMAWLW